MYKLSFNNIFIPRRLDEIEKKEKQRIQRLLEQEVIDGDLDLSQNKFIKDLGNIKRVEGDLNLSNSSIQSLGNLEYVRHSLYLQNTSIQTLGNLEHVGINLWLNNSQVQSLGNLEYVGGNLILTDTKIQDLGNLKYVGWNLYLHDTPLFKKFKSKEKLRKYIKSKIKFDGSIFV